ncbi:hypothetical protein JCM24511_09351 [Saitozyma sp. JCM 24511]|nr:hypothetical protein JCM24511_09351 [Saitozyma sp. JCM 24511]
MFVQAGMIKLGTRPSGYVAAAMVFLYQGIFAIGWMAGVWVYSSEIISLSWRSKDLGLAVASEWIFDFTVLMITPIAINKIGYGIFILFGALNLCFIPLLYFYCPETAGIPLEAIDAVYRPGVDPVKEARRLRRQLKEAKKPHANVESSHIGNTGGILAETVGDEKVVIGHTEEI